MNNQEYTEPRKYICAQRCGAEFVIEYPESVIWDDYELTVLTDNGWVLKGESYYCPAHKEDEQ